jgi:hypothetical protein
MMEFGMFILFKVMFLHIHRWSFFFGGSRHCGSMCDSFFTGDSGCFRDCDKYKFVGGNFGRVVEGVKGVGVNSFLVNMECCLSTYFKIIYTMIAGAS